MHSDEVKDISAITAAVKSRLGPRDEFSWTRSDDAPELNNALEACGGKHFPGVLYSLNSYLMERVTLSFGDMRRTIFAQSGCAPYCRPTVGISAAQQ